MFWVVQYITDPYDQCFMSMYSVLGSTRLWAGTCQDEVEHPQAYSCGESLPIYILNNVEMSQEAYTPWLCWNKLTFGCCCVSEGHDVETQPDISCLIPSVKFDLDMYQSRGKWNYRNLCHAWARINKFIGLLAFWWDWGLSTDLEITHLISPGKTYLYMY